MSPCFSLIAFHRSSAAQFLTIRDGLSFCRNAQPKVGSFSSLPGFGSGVKSDVTKLAGNSPDLPSSSPFHQLASLGMKIRSAMNENTFNNEQYMQCSQVNIYNIS